MNRGGELLSSVMKCGFKQLIEHFFRVYIASPEHEGGGGRGGGAGVSSRQLCKLETQSTVCITLDKSTITQLLR